MDTTLLSANASLSAFQRAQYECIEQRPTFARFLIDPRPHTELDHSARRPGPITISWNEHDGSVHTLRVGLTRFLGSEVSA